MDVIPSPQKNGVFRACWANTGRKSHTDSVVENWRRQSEIMASSEPSSPVRTTDWTIRPLNVSRAARKGHADNVATSRAASRGPRGRRCNVEGGTAELRSATQIYLPTEKDGDALSDGCACIWGSTTAEPTGSSFRSGEGWRIQHRAYSDAHQLVRCSVQLK
jgi:hypothetical protein